MSIVPQEKVKKVCLLLLKECKNGLNPKERKRITIETDDVTLVLSVLSVRPVPSDGKVKKKKEEEETDDE